MIETFFTLPFPFWVVLVLLLAGNIWAGGKLRAGTGLPVIAVLGTVTTWYVGDLFYNDDGAYTQTFTPDILENAWWQVALFLILFLLFVPIAHHLFNAKLLRQTSSVYRMFRTGVDYPLLQQRLTLLFRSGVLVWVVLSVIAAIRLGNELPYYFFPFLDHRSDPWGRGRLGSGIDSLLSSAGYLQLFVATSFGIVAALVKAPRIRRLAILGCAVTWPYYIFDRTRNTMLSAVLPAILAWTFLRFRGGWVKKSAALAGFFLLLSAWFGFVIANRSSMSIAQAIEQRGFNFTSARVHHYGLNMYEELCWINNLVADANYQPNLGGLFLAELVSPIPRVLWPDKPAPSLDYAVARGQDALEGGTVSMGMIGQGVVNFGRVFGPAFAALLMSMWCAILARLDLRGREVTLYGLGLSLTFNLGRDITMVTLYTFVFGALVVWCLNRSHWKTDRSRQVRRPSRERSRLQPRLNSRIFP